MFTINIAKECGCFKRSEFENNMTFESKDEALMQAKVMESHMNQKFCQKHMFYTEETAENTFTIQVEERPRGSTGGCCGGGHCS